MNTRLERDSMGEIRVPADKLWGAQTQRSSENFRIGTERMPMGLIQALVLIKKAAARANLRLDNLTDEQTRVIVHAADEIIAGTWDEHFPLAVWQTGSGTQSNMNVNEVMAAIANQELAREGSLIRIHPIDDVNRSQSSNDVFPTAMHIAGVLAVEDSLLPAVRKLKETFRLQTERFAHIVKIGRTHLQDATPLSLGQEISGWYAMLDKTERMILNSIEAMKDLAIGGTAVGTGLNAPAQFGDTAAEEITRLTGRRFRSADNKFHALTSHDEIVYVHGAIKALAVNLMKIANDVRWLASGPRCGIGELSIPENEPGSSIMPGKVNPTQSEALTMVVCQVMGNDAAIGFAASQGNFELNVFKPVIIYNFLQSVGLLSDAIHSFHDHCVAGIEPNLETIQSYLHHSLMLVTALNPHIGYENAAKIAKLAHEQGISLKEAAVRTKLLTAEQFEQWVIPENMI